MMNFVALVNSHLILSIRKKKIIRRVDLIEIRKRDTKNKSLNTLINESEKRL